MSSNFLNDENKGDIIIYQSESGETKIDVRFQDETVWLTQAQMEELFQSSHANVVEHIKNIYSEGELDESSTCRKFRQVRREGNRNVERERLYYNLDMIISLGYRIRSSIATQFRRWALSSAATPPKSRSVLRNMSACRSPSSEKGISSSCEPGVILWQMPELTRMICLSSSVIALLS